VSIHLAERAAQLAGIPFANVLRKTSSDDIELDARAASSLRGRRVGLIDDQATSGATFRRCWQVLSRVNSKEITDISWSASGLHQPWSSQHTAGLCWLNREGTLGAHVRLACQNTA
jgi:hypothetical protein